VESRKGQEGFIHAEVPDTNVIDRVKGRRGNAIRSNSYSASFHCVTEAVRRVRGGGGDSLDVVSTNATVITGSSGV